MIEESQILRLNDFVERAVSDEDNVMIWKSNDINPKKTSMSGVKDFVKDYVLENLPSQDNELMPPTSIANNENYPAEVIGHYATFQGLDVININLQNANGDNYVIPITAEQRANFAHLKLALSLTLVYDGETRITNLESFKDKRVTITLHVAFIENEGDEINENDIVTLTEFVRLNALSGFPTAENMYQHWNVLRAHYVSNSQINLYANDYYCKAQQTQQSGTDYETQIELFDENATYVIDDNFSSVGAGVKNNTTLEINYDTTTLDEDAGTIQLNGSLSNDMTLPLVANEKGFQILDERTQAVYKVPYQGTAIISYLSSTDVWTVVVPSNETQTVVSNGNYIVQHSLPRDFDFAAIENNFITAEVVDADNGEYEIHGLDQETIFNSFNSHSDAYIEDEIVYDADNSGLSLTIDDAYIMANFQSVVENGITYYILDSFNLRVTNASSPVSITIDQNISVELRLHRTGNVRCNSDDIKRSILNSTNFNLTIVEGYSSYSINPRCCWWGGEDRGSYSNSYNPIRYGEKLAVLIPISGVLPCGIYQCTGGDGDDVSLKLIAKYEDVNTVSVPQEMSGYPTIGDKVFQRVKGSAALSGRGYFKLISSQKCLVQGVVAETDSLSLTNTNTANDVRCLKLYFGNNFDAERPNFTGCLYSYRNGFIFSQKTNGVRVNVNMTISNHSSGLGRSDMLHIYMKNSTFDNRNEYAQILHNVSNMYSERTGMPNFLIENSCLVSDGHSSSDLFSGMSAYVAGSFGNIDTIQIGIYVQKFEAVNSGERINPLLSAQTTTYFKVLAGSNVLIEFEPPF